MSAYLLIIGNDYFFKKNTKTYESPEEVKEKGKRKMKEKTGTSYSVL